MQKQTLLFISLFFILIPTSAQFSVGSGSGVQATSLSTPHPNIDDIFFFNGLTNASIDYTYNEGATFTWSSYTTDPNITTPIKTESGIRSTLTQSDLVNATGYILDINPDDFSTPPVKYYIWVIDLKNYPLQIQPPTVIASNADPCNYVDVTSSASNPVLTYVPKTGGTQFINREITLSYKTLSWNEQTYDEKEETYSKNIENSGSIFFQTPQPLENTTYTISGDQFLKALNAEEKSNSTENYVATAIEAHILGEINERPYKNENERIGPTGNKSISGSGPLIVHLTSNATPAVQYYEWFIFNIANRANVNYYTDKDLRYTFPEVGTYIVKLKASNITHDGIKCSLVEDSLTVKVVESDIKVPNAFTPNGDGMNDEFRVIYKSIKSFQCVIYNRWGRKVYESSDPGKGWDGKIGSKVAEPGAYFYIIEAEGDFGDGVTKRKLKGDINLIRGK